MRTLRVTVRAGYAGRVSVTPATRVHGWGAPGHYRYEERWSERPHGHSLAGAEAYDSRGDTELRADPMVFDFIVRDDGRHPYVRVRARRDPGLLARGSDSERLA